MHNKEKGTQRRKLTAEGKIKRRKRIIKKKPNREGKVTSSK